MFLIILIDIAKNPCYRESIDIMYQRTYFLQELQVCKMQITKILSIFDR